MPIQLNPEKWINLYADAFLVIARYKIKNEGDAEDIVQETFLSAFKAKDSFKGDSSEKTWLTSILRNKIIDYYKKNTIHSEHLFVDEEIEDTFFEEDGHWRKEAAPKNWTIDASNTTIWNELNRILNLCFDKLPPMLKNIASLKFKNDEDSQFICQSLNISSSNLWTSIHRSRLILRECLEQKYLNK